MVPFAFDMGHASCNARQCLAATIGASSLMVSSSSALRQDSNAGAQSAIVLDVAREGREAGQLRLTLASNQRCVFGRHPSSCDVVLEHLSISRQHAHLSMDVTGRCFVTDMGSGMLLHSFR